MKSLGLHYAKDDLRTVFAVTGGLPAYVQYFDNGESIDTNIINLFFISALFEETQHILHRDMKNITGANAILSGLYTLERPYVELLQASQIKSGTFTSRLNDLMAMGLVGRIQANSRGPAKYADYHFTNSMFHFWYRYVYKYWGDIVRGNGADVYQTYVKPQLKDFVKLLYCNLIRHLIRHHTSSVVSFCVVYLFCRSILLNLIYVPYSFEFYLCVILF